MQNNENLLNENYPPEHVFEIEFNAEPLTIKVKNYEAVKAEKYQKNPLVPVALDLFKRGYPEECVSMMIHKFIQLFEHVYFAGYENFS